MTNQEKDLQNAREYLETHFPKLLETLMNDYFIELGQILSGYVQHLDSIGKIKFTENRFNEETR